MKVTIGGLSGTGTSSIGKALAKHYNYEFVSGGNFARQLAASFGMTMEERDKFTMENNIFTDDAQIDGMQKEYGNTKDNFVLESRLGWFNVPDSIKIKLYCEDKVRFERTSKADPNRMATKIEDFEATMKKSLQREEDHRQRIENLYGIKNLADDNHFDIVIDTTPLTFEEVLQKCIEYIDSRK
jgi:cytidylate kinase